MGEFVLVGALCELIGEFVLGALCELMGEFVLVAFCYLMGEFNLGALCDLMGEFDLEGMFNLLGEFAVDLTGTTFYFGELALNDLIGELTLDFIFLGTISSR